MSKAVSASEPFVPFTPSGPAASPASGPHAAPSSASTLRITGRDDDAPAFCPLETRAPGSSHGGTGPAEPVVTFERDGDRIMAIRIECKCGQVIELACKYDGPVLAP